MNPRDHAQRPWIHWTLAIVLLLAGGALIGHGVQHDWWITIGAGALLIVDGLYLGVAQVNDRLKG